MKRAALWILLLSFAFAWSDAQALSSTDREKLAELKQTSWFYKLQAAERKNCRRFYRSGEYAGARAYSMRFKSCSDFLLAGGSFDRFFPTQDPQLDPEDKCFDSGYRYGYLMENHRQWTPCAEELSALISEANTEAIAECRKIASETSRSLTEIVDNMKSGINGDQDERDIEAFARILFFTNAGFGASVWNDVLKLVVKGQKDIISCEIILASGLAGDNT